MLVVGGYLAEDAVKPEKHAHKHTASAASQNAGWLQPPVDKSLGFSQKKGRSGWLAGWLHLCGFTWGSGAAEVNET